MVRLGVLGLVGLRRIPLLLIVWIWRHHGTHWLRIVMLIPRVRTHMRPAVGYIMLPLVRSHGHLLPRWDPVRIHYWQLRW